MEDIGRFLWYHRSMKKDLCGGMLHGSLFLLDYGFYVFTDRSAFLTPSGGSIFLLVKKDRGERHAKGLQSRPLESCFYTGDRRGDVLTPYEFALVHFTRFRLVRWRAVSFSFLRLRQKQTLPLCNTLCGCKHCFRRTLAYCTNCG